MIGYAWTVNSCGYLIIECAAGLVRSTYAGDLPFEHVRSFVARVVRDGSDQ